MPSELTINLRILDNVGEDSDHEEKQILQQSMMAASSDSLMYAHT